jgi:hypothetical protein
MERSDVSRNPAFLSGPAAILSVGGLTAYVPKVSCRAGGRTRSEPCGRELEFAEGVRNRILNDSDVQPWLECYFIVALMTNKEHGSTATAKRVARI